MSRRNFFVWVNRDLYRISEWCVLCGIRLNARNTKTMIVSRSVTRDLLHHQSPLNCWWNCSGWVCRPWYLSVTFLDVTFDSNMIIEKHLRSVYRAASQRLWCSAHNAHLNLVDRVVSGASFLASGVLHCTLSHRRSIEVLCILYEIRSNPMYPLCGPLPVPFGPVLVTRGA